jgi:hypothetical protein
MRCAPIATIQPTADKRRIAVKYVWLIPIDLSRILTIAILGASNCKLCPILHTRMAYMHNDSVKSIPRQPAAGQRELLEEQPFIDACTVRIGTQLPLLKDEKVY